MAEMKSLVNQVIVGQCYASHVPNVTDFFFVLFCHIKPRVGIIDHAGTHYGAELKQQTSVI